MAAPPAAGRGGAARACPDRPRASPAGSARRRWCARDSHSSTGSPSCGERWLCAAQGAVRSQTRPALGARCRRKTVSAGRARQLARYTHSGPSLSTNLAAFVRRAQALACSSLPGQAYCGMPCCTAACRHVAAAAPQCAGTGLHLLVGAAATLYPPISGMGGWARNWDKVGFLPTRPIPWPFPRNAGKRRTRRGGSADGEAVRRTPAAAGKNGWANTAPGTRKPRARACPETQLDPGACPR